MYVRAVEASAGTLLNLSFPSLYFRNARRSSPGSPGLWASCACCKCDPRGVNVDVSLRDVVLRVLLCQAGGLLPGSGELLAGVDPRVVDLPASTAPNEVMHMYTTTRSAYNVTKADHNLSADGPGHFRPFMSGETFNNASRLTTR